MRKLIAPFTALAVALLAVLPALAQPSTFPAKTEQPWFPQGRLASPITATGSTGATLLPTTGFIAWMCNTGAADAWVGFGTANTVTTSTTTGTYLKAGSCSSYDLFPAVGAAASPYTYVATITGGTSTTITVETGMGQPPLNSDTTVTGTIAATQGTSPWVDSITQWGGGTLGAMANYGTSPGAVLVPGVNSFVTGGTLGVAAGQAAIGNVGALTKTVCATPTVTNGTYAANVVVGGLLTLTNLYTSTGHGTIQSVSMNFNTAQTVGFLLFPFRGSPTNASTWTDHSAAAISGFTDIALTDSPISLANPNSALGTMTNYGANGLGQAYNPAGTSGYFILVPTATTASLGATANAVQVCVTVLQDS